MTGIAGALAGIHLGIAMLSKHDHWQLDEQESEMISKSVINVARHYPSVAGSQKLIDWAMLFSTLGAAWVPRVMMSKDIIERRRQTTTDVPQAERIF